MIYPVSFKKNIYLHEPVESGESLDFHAVSETLGLSGIDLSDGHGRVLGGKDGSGTLVLGGKFFAVTTIYEGKVISLYSTKFLASI